MSMSSLLCYSPMWLLLLKSELFIFILKEYLYFYCFKINHEICQNLSYFQKSICKKPCHTWTSIFIMALVRLSIGWMV